jgi:hypothetical protein
MIEWIDFENKLLDSAYYSIDNNSKKKIVLFGNCHMASIGFFVNYLFNQQYNIYIIISWLFDKNGFENFDMKKVNNQITTLLSKCDILIYQQHIKSYGIQAHIIDSFVSSNSIVIKIPNLRLSYMAESKEEYYKSLIMLEFSINSSDLKEFEFIISNIKDIHFFNTSEHPTHYVLFLLAKSIKNYIFNINMKVFYKPLTLDDYYNNKNRLLYKKISNYVVLPGREIITQKINNITGIQINGDYFD